MSTLMVRPRDQSLIEVKGDRNQVVPNTAPSSVRLSSAEEDTANNGRKQLRDT